MNVKKIQDINPITSNRKNNLQFYAFGIQLSVPKVEDPEHWAPDPQVLAPNIEDPKHWAHGIQLSMLKVGGYNLNALGLQLLMPKVGNPTKCFWPSTFSVES